MNSKSKKQSVRSVSFADGRFVEMFPTLELRGRRAEVGEFLRGLGPPTTSVHTLWPLVKTEADDSGGAES